MSHLPFTILAYLLNGVAVTVDKFILAKHVPNPLIYVFYFSLVSSLALLILPFTNYLPTNTLILASISTILWTTGAYFMFKALQIGQVSRVIPIIGTLIPTFLLFLSLATGSISQTQIFAVLSLVLGLVFLTLPDWRGDFNTRELGFEVLSSLFFAVSYVFLHQAYTQADFLSVLVWSRMVLVPLGVAVVVIPTLRRMVFASSGPKINFFSKVGVLFAVGQICGGVSELLITFAVSLANPALVNSLQGVQYVFLFVLSLTLAKKYPQIFKERVVFKALGGKVLGIGLIGLGLFLLAYR